MIDFQARANSYALNAQTIYRALFKSEYAFRDIFAYCVIENSAIFRAHSVLVSQSYSQSSATFD